jgi:taurine dioxygenase
MSAGSPGLPVTVEPLAGALGLAVRGIDLRDVDADAIDWLRRLWHRRLLLVLPDQHLTADEHVALARHLGVPGVHPDLPTDPDRPEIVVLESDTPLAEEWHTDQSFEADPPEATLIRMVTAPAAGGDTQWSSLEAAWMLLSVPLQRLLSTLTAEHATPSGDRSARHRLVRRHRVTGRPCLFVNRHFTRRIVELNETESDVLLMHLFAVAESPRVTCRWRWAEGDVALWDNRCTQHSVVGDYSTPRRVERISLLREGGLQS